MEVPILPLVLLSRQPSPDGHNSRFISHCFRRSTCDVLCTAACDYSEHTFTSILARPRLQPQSMRCMGDESVCEAPRNHDGTLERGRACRLNVHFIYVVCVNDGTRFSTAKVLCCCVWGWAVAQCELEFKFRQLQPRWTCVCSAHCASLTQHSIFNSTYSNMDAVWKRLPWHEAGDGICRVVD